MVDMTDNKEKQKDFITNILLDVDGSNYYVLYADGTIEKNKFDIESYNEVLLEMEREYYNYKESYYNRKNDERFFNSLKVIATDLLTALGVFLLYNIDISDLLKVATSFIVVLTGILIHQKYNRKVYESDQDIQELHLMEELINRKEKFATEIIDPETGETKKWYIVNLSNIYKIQSIAALNKYTNEEIKLKKIPNFLKRNSELNNA